MRTKTANFIKCICYILPIIIAMHPSIAWGHDFHASTCNQNFIVANRLASLDVNTDYILQAYPADLIGNDSVKLHTTKRNIPQIGQDNSTRISRSDDTESKFLVAETTDFGQLKEMLDNKDVDQIDSLVVKGPMDESDFDAIWNVAVIGNLLTLNLEDAIMKDNAVPDYALYHPIQFDYGYWLKLKKIILPYGIEKIGIAAFPFMDLEEINIPSTVRDIGSTCFAYDYWLDGKLEIPEGVEHIKFQTFYNCRSLSTPPILPSSLKRIGSHAFANTPFTELCFPEGLSRIDEGAFQCCGLSQVVIPDSCLEIGDMVFQISPNIEEIHFPKKLKYIPVGLFSFCDALKKVTLPAECEEIGVAAFMWCVNLEQIDLNDGLEVIGKDAFDGCLVKRIHLPKTLLRLGGSCFGDCFELQEIYCEASIPPVCEEDATNPGWGPFVTDKSNITLFIPKGTKDAYQSQWEWYLFPNISETDDFPWSNIPSVVINNPFEQELLYDLMGNHVKYPIKGHIYISQGRKVIY